MSGQTCVALELDPAGKFLAIGSNDANVTLWDLNGLFPVQEVTRQQQPVRSMSFNQDGRFIATCTEEHYVDIALVETGEKVWSFQSDEREKDLMNLVGVAFHPKRPVLACAYDVRDRNHRDRDNSIIRIFGVAPGIVVTTGTILVWKNQLDERTKLTCVRVDATCYAKIFPVFPGFFVSFARICRKVVEFCTRLGA